MICSVTIRLSAGTFSRLMTFAGELAVETGQSRFLAENEEKL